MSCRKEDEVDEVGDKGEEKRERVRSEDSVAWEEGWMEFLPANIPSNDCYTFQGCFKLDVHALVIYSVSTVLLAIPIRTHNKPKHSSIVVRTSRLSRHRGFAARPHHELDGGLAGRMTAPLIR